MEKLDWSKVNSSYLLTLDPFYNKKINDCKEFIPPENVFFSELFVEPSKNNSSMSKDNEIRNAIKGRTNNLILFIKGYAGCGKSVYIQKLMYDLYPYNKNFAENTYNFKAKSIHKLETGSGTSSNDIKSRYIKDLSDNIAFAINKDESLFNLFCSIIADNGDAIQFIDNEGIIFDDFINSTAIIECIDKDYETIRKTIKIELKKYDYPILFAIDCLWRITCHMKKHIDKEDNDAMFFICFDNLDAIDDIELCKGFISSLCEFKSNLDRCLYELNNDHIEYNIKTFTFILSCRNVTWGRLDLSENLNDDEEGSVSEHIREFDISNFFEYVDIVQERIRYFSKLAGEDPEAKCIIKEMAVFKDLNEMRYIKESFKPLFNYNYRKCIRVISEILQYYKSYIQEAIDLVSYDEFSEDDDVYSGSSSIFFRLVFEYFQKNRLLDYSILNLVDVSKPYKKGIDNKSLTSQARILLLYIYNESQKVDGGNTRLDQIFDYFNGIYQPKDICNTLFKLFERNIAWRRPIYFSKRPLIEHKEQEDLENQMNIYLATKTHNPEDFTKFEICQAGKEYIDFVIAHFEFFSCRKSKNDSRIDLPPLFSEKSFIFKESIEKYVFEITCDYVIDAVEECCKKLFDFDLEVIEKKNLQFDEYLLEPVNKKTVHNNPQLHQERVIFCHIYHLEAFRFYAINSFFKDKPMDLRADINSRIISIIKKYINVYNNCIIDNHRDYIIKGLCSRIKTIEDSKYQDFTTRISYTHKLNYKI